MSTAGVEVSEQSTVPLLERLAGLLEVGALSLDVVENDILNASLCTAVSVGRANGAGLGNRNHVLEAGGVAVDGSRGGEDNVGDVVLGHGAKERDAATDVDAVVLEGDFSGFTDGLHDG